jgi:hypothetical protein
MDIRQNVRAPSMPFVKKINEIKSFSYGKTILGCQKSRSSFRALETNPSVALFKFR